VLGTFDGLLRDPGPEAHPLWLSRQAGYRSLGGATEDCILCPVNPGLTPRLLLLLALAGCPGAPPATDTAASDGPVTDRSPGDSTPDALLDALYDEVQAYLTAEDPGPNPVLLGRLDTVYRDVPFAEVARAVRDVAPATWPGTGVHQHSWVNPFYGGTETYHVYVPPTLSSNTTTRRFPLLIFLHGAGGDGANVVGEAAVRQAAEALGTILVAPTSNPKCDWNQLEECMSQTVMLVQHLKRRYPVDDDRVVLSGFSMGGRGSFSVGVAYPEPYCGVVPVAGSIGAVHNTSDLGFHKAYCCPHTENVFNLRLHYISGALDMALMLYQNRGCALCLEGQGADFVYTELPGQGHVWPLDTWQQAVAWALQRPREPYPARVVYHLATQASAILPDDLWLQQTLRVPQYWADIELRRDPSRPARIEARRDGNRIWITSTNVARVGLYLADSQLDLRQPVQVYSRERLLLSSHVRRDRRLLLTEARRRSERSMIFAARLTLQLDEGS